MFDTHAEDVELAFCACDQQVYDGVDHGSDGFLNIQEFKSPKCQVHSWTFPKAKEAFDLINMAIL